MTIEDQKLGIILAVNEKILWVNKEFTELTGFTVMDFAGKEFLEKSKIFNSSKLMESIYSCLRYNNFFSRIIEDASFTEDNFHCWSVKLNLIGNSNQKLVTVFPINLINNQQYRITQKYASSNLTKALSSSIYMKIKQLFDEKQIFKNEKCNLASVASQLGTNTKYLSQVINTKTGLNFRELVNRYRVNHFKYLVLNGFHQKLSIEGLANECGFKNKVSFYKAVKKFTDVTPKILIKKLSS